MIEKTSERLLLPNNVDAAISALEALGEDSALLAGGTWIMRAAVRRERADKTLVSLTRIEELRDITVTRNALSIGSLVTHEALHRAIADEPDLQALKLAAGQSANPSIRRAATIGGNLCTRAFAASDIIPALISCGAHVTVRFSRGESEYPVEEFLRADDRHLGAGLVTRITVLRSSCTSAHVRLLMRRAGEYPVANVSACVATADDGEIVFARVAVGSVERTARRWSGLEAAVVGNRIDNLNIRSIASEHSQEFRGRDAADAPGWYRVRVLPALAAQAFTALKRQAF